jgi:hypothetical protein
MYFALYPNRNRIHEDWQMILLMTWTVLHKPYLNLSGNLKFNWYLNLLGMYIELIGLIET